MSPVNPLRNFGFLLKDVSRLYGRRFEERARTLGLTLPQCKVLVYLARCEGISQAQLADRTEIEPMTLVRILDHMESGGWLERRDAPADRRARSLFLKAAARPLVEQIWAVADDTRGEALADIDEAEALRFLQQLETMRANFLELSPYPAAKRRTARGVKS